MEETLEAVLSLYNIKPELPPDVIYVLAPLIGHGHYIEAHRKHVLEQVLHLAPLDLEWEEDNLLLLGLAEVGAALAVASLAS